MNHKIDETHDMPVDAVLAVTYRCNARCTMCGIWKTKSGAELPPETYAKLPSSLRDINLTGGEPFLRQDLAALHAEVKRACPAARTVISTNGLLTERIVSAVREIARTEPHIGVAISIDGPADIHDRLRGVPGNYEKAIATVKALQKAGFKNLRIAFTATPANARYLSETYDLAHTLGVQFTCAIEHSSEHYFHSDKSTGPLPLDELRRQLEQVMRRELRAISPKRWARAYFMQGLYDLARGRGRPLRCRAGRDFFFMAPSGEIYTCNASPFRMGSLAEQNFDALWHSTEAENARRQVAACETGCWMICTARTAIRRAWPRVLLWAATRCIFGLRLPEATP